MKITTLASLVLLLSAAVFSGCQKTDAQHAKELERQMELEKTIAMAKLEAEAKAQEAALRSQRAREERAEETKRLMIKLLHGFASFAATIAVIGVSVYGINRTIQRFRERQKDVEQMQERFRLTICTVERTLPSLPPDVGARYLAELVKATRDPRSIQGNVDKVLAKASVIDMPTEVRRA